MTLRRYQILAMIATIVALFSMAASVVKQTSYDRASVMAAQQLQHVTQQLETARTVLTVMRRDSARATTERRALVAAAVVRPIYAPRQRTTVVIDAGLTPSAVDGVRRLTAERDSAITDRDSARADAVRLRVTIVRMDSLATMKDSVDATSRAKLVIVVDTVATAVDAVRTLVRPPLYRRIGSVLIRAGKVVLVVVTAFELGRMS